MLILKGALFFRTNLQLAKFHLVPNHLICPIKEVDTVVITPAATTSRPEYLWFFSDAVSKFCHLQNFLE